MIRPLAQQSDKLLFWGFALLVLLCGLGTTALENPLPLVLPIGLLFVLFVIHSPKNLYYFFFFLLPFSVEIHLGSLGTDLPSEPLMVVMMASAFLLLLTGKGFGKRELTHPITIVLLLHLLWIVFTTITSTDVVVSAKYVLAKLWYVVPFYFLPLILMKNEKDYRKIFFFLSLSLFVAVTFVMVKHAGKGFSFASSNKVVRPIFRNHVNYAAMLVVFLPYFWYLIRTTSSKYKGLLYPLLLFLLAAIYFSFTRAAQMSVVLAIIYQVIVRLKLTKIAIGISIVLGIVLSMFLSYENKYLDFAPEFDKTITHKKFDNLVEATTKMQDISTVERFYRWVAGGYMLADKPLLGFGPATFYSNYQPYTVTSYKTYVSDNPEKSGIHNNYLMVAVEQGLLGLFFMLLLAIVPLFFAEQAYHQLSQAADKALLLAAATSYFIIDVVILINDLLEADKVGPFYFLSGAIILFYSLKTSRVQASSMP